ncbi:unnamed protein product, partial [Brenthis ino]
MDGDEIDSWSDPSSGDELLCAQLQEAGLMSKYKRRKQSCKEDKKRIKLNLNQKDNTSSSDTKACNSPNKYEIIATPINKQNFGESMKSILSSQDNVKTTFNQNIDLDVENIDINNLQVIEKVGNDFFDLQQVPTEFAAVAIEYPSVLNDVKIAVESENVVQELGNIVLDINAINLNHDESFPTSNQDILVSTNTQAQFLI